MTTAERHIVKTYARLFEGLSYISKLELMELLAKSLKKENPDKEAQKEKEFFKSFGAFGSDKSAEEIAREIKESRRFREKDLNI